jgi:hypothetical protein
VRGRERKRERGGLLFKIASAWVDVNKRANEVNNRRAYLEERDRQGGGQTSLGKQTDAEKCAIACLSLYPFHLSREEGNPASRRPDSSPARTRLRTRVS